MGVHPVIGVVSGCGGGGASVLAATLAGCAGEPRSGGGLGRAFLIDCDPLGGGIDVLLGCEQVPGPRWGQVRLRGGFLDPAVLLDTLPRWGRVRFLAADTPDGPGPESLAGVIAAAASVAPVVLDLPRWPSAVRTVALHRCDHVVLVTPAEVRAVTSSAVVSAGLDDRITGVAVRGVSRSLPAGRIGVLLGLPVLGEIPYDPASLRPAGYDLQKLRRGTRRLAERILLSSGVTAGAPAAGSTDASDSARGSAGASTVAAA